MKESLERFNEWWFTGKIRKELAPPFRRRVFTTLLDHAKERQVVMITGMRRVGKTTLMYQVIEHLLKITDPTRILYFSFDEAQADPKQVLELYEKRILMKPFEDVGKVYLFFDEVQFAKNWAGVLKRFYDLYPKLKIFISGSSSLLHSREALTKLAGRFFFVEIPPLTFTEFLQMKGIKVERLETSARRAEAYFLDYLRKSGFPEIVDWESDVKIAEYIRNSVIDRVVFRDLPLMFRTRDMALTSKLVEAVLSNPGAIINVNSLARDWGENRITISNHLRFLEHSLLIRSLGNYRPAHRSVSRKLRKYYPAVPSLIFSYWEKSWREKLGSVLETYGVGALNAKYYFRKGGREADIVLVNEKLLPIEVKTEVKTADLKRFARVVDFLRAKRGLVITLGQRSKMGNIEVLPAYLLETVSNL